MNDRSNCTPLATVDRRRALTKIASIFGMGSTGLVFNGHSHAADYPSKPVHLLVGPRPPGGPADFLARLFGDAAGSELGKTFVVENRAGASGTLAAEATARAQADGYTLLVAGQGAMVIAPLIFSKLNFATTDFVPLALLGAGALVLVVQPSLPVKNAQELVALIRARPRALTFGSGGNGSSGHVCGQMFAQQIGGRILHVPYKGDAMAAADLVGGQIEAMFAAPNVAVPHVKSGRLRALAVTTSERHPLMPDVPTVHESAIDDFEYLGWIMAFAPAATPPAIVDLLSATWSKARTQGPIRARLDDLGMSAPDRYATPQAVVAFLSAEQTRLSRVIRDAGIKAD